MPLLSTPHSILRRISEHTVLFKAGQRLRIYCALTGKTCPTRIILPDLSGAVLEAKSNCLEIQ
jgi:hypothetical protein